MFTLVCVSSSWRLTGGLLATLYCYVHSSVCVFQLAVDRRFIVVIKRVQESADHRQLKSMSGKQHFIKLSSLGALQR